MIPPLFGAFLLKTLEMKLRFVVNFKRMVLSTWHCIPSTQKDIAMGALSNESADIQIRFLPNKFKLIQIIFLQFTTATDHRV